MPGLRIVWGKAADDSVGGTGSVPVWLRDGV